MFTLTSATQAAGVISLIPQPLTVSNVAGEFEIRPDTKITFVGGEAEAKLLAVTLRKSTGYKLPVSAATSPVSLLPAKSEISFLLDTNLVEKLGPEGYQLNVNINDVSIAAAAPAGLFYGSQTLLQLLPPEIFSTGKMHHVFWTAQCVEISDAPRFGWRGFMLDVSRHFFTVPEVEHVLDLMALYKLNTFHWHLTDDQGWRIEIKKYPKLTSVGAWRKAVGFGLNPKSTTAYDAQGRYGGFYTQKEIRQVVAYAAARHITIVPEIEMPGHSLAALAAYPQFSCTGGPFTPDRDSGVYSGIFNVSDDATYVFLGDILHEVAGLFPGKFIHIGGDEVRTNVWHDSPACQAMIKARGLKNEHELQSYFTARMEAIVNTNGKSIIGWSEIREGGLTPSAALMDWKGGGAESAASGHDVVMSPSKFAYLDHCQSTNRLIEPKTNRGYLPFKQAYDFDPVPAELAPEKRAHILGGQANLWTEDVPNIRQVEYMMFPRLGAIAEADWSPKEARDWDSFKVRTAMNEKRLDVMGVNYRPLAKPEY